MDQELDAGLERDQRRGGESLSRPSPEYTPLPQAPQPAPGPSPWTTLLLALTAAVATYGTTLGFLVLSGPSSEQARAYAPVDVELPVPKAPAPAPQASPLPVASAVPAPVPEPTAVAAGDLAPTVGERESLVALEAPAREMAASLTTRDEETAPHSTPQGGEPNLLGESLRGVELKDLDGRIVRMDAWPKGRNVMVAFAPWCGYCQKEAGLVKEAGRGLALRGIPLRVVVSNDAPGHLRRFAEQFGPRALLDGDNVVRARAYPEYVVTDGAGNIVKTHLGAFGSAAEAVAWAAQD